MYPDDIDDYIHIVSTDRLGNPEKYRCEVEAKDKKLALVHVSDSKGECRQWLSENLWITAYDRDGFKRAIEQFRRLSHAI